MYIQTKQPGLTLKPRREKDFLQKDVLSLLSALIGYSVVLCVPLGYSVEGLPCLEVFTIYVTNVRNCVFPPLMKSS